jgi:hypothetical protein
VIGAGAFPHPRPAVARRHSDLLGIDSIYIELINYPMLFKLKASAAEYKAGLDLAIERG